MVLNSEKSAGELALKALSDTTKYDALEVGHGLCDTIEAEFRKSIEIYRDRIDQPQFCVVMLKGEDRLLKNLIRRKFYCWPFLPKPRPNQAVFLYDKAKDAIIKRLWVLPCAAVMAELSISDLVVHPRYKTMQTWSRAFFNGNFWELIREQHGIFMLSEHEHIKSQGFKVLQPELNLTLSFVANAANSSEIITKQLVNPRNPIIQQNGFGTFR